MSNASHDVLQGYFDELLTSEPLDLDISPEPAVRIEPAVLPRESVVEPAERDLAREKLAKLLASSPLTIAETSENVGAQVSEEVTVEVAPETTSIAESSTLTEVVAQPLSTEVISEPVSIAVVDEPVEGASAEQDDVSIEWMENGRPSWAQDRFEVLLFEVAGLTLAVPLISLGQIQPLTDELTPLFGQAEWFMGLQPTPVGKIRTINTARFVMPERYEEKFAENARYVVSIDGLPWGLAVDAVNQPITLQPEDVKWRGERSKRPWLAGTVKQHMCALLDIPAMGVLLNAADRKKSSQDPLKS